MGLTMVARVAGRAELKWWKLLYLYIFFLKGICWDDVMKVLTIMTKNIEICILRREL